MPFHSVRFVDTTSGVVREQRIEAETPTMARAQVESKGHVVIELVRRPFLWSLPARRPAGVLESGEVALLCRELKALLAAGLSIVEALDALAASRTEVHGFSIHAALLDRLREGKSLSTALRNVGGFPSLLIASVQASERTSNLNESLDAYLRYDEMMGTLKRRVISAALYPTIVIALGLMVTVFLLLVVIPRFAALYGEMGGGAGSTTRIILSVSLSLRQNPWMIPIGAVGLAGVLVYLSWADRWRQLVQWVLANVPWLQSQVGSFERARVYEALALLVKGGYTLHEALGLSSGVSGGPEGARRILLARDAIERGTGVALAFSTAGLTDAVTERLLRAGDRGGEFDRVLKAIAERHAREFETFVERTTRVVEPVLLLAVALLVGSMVVLLYMPIFDIASSVH